MKGERTKAACLASAMAEIGQPEIHWPQPINAQVSRAIEGHLDSRIAQARLKRPIWPVKRLFA